MRAVMSALMTASADSLCSLISALARNPPETQPLHAVDQIWLAAMAPATVIDVTPVESR